VNDNVDNDFLPEEDSASLEELGRMLCSHFRNSSSDVHFVHVQEVITFRIPSCLFTPTKRGTYFTTLCCLDHDSRSTFCVG